MFDQLGRLFHLLLDDRIDSGIINRVFQLVTRNGFIQRSRKNQVHDKVITNLPFLGHHTMISVEFHCFKLYPCCHNSLFYL